MTVLMSSAEACIPFDSMRATSLPASGWPLAVLGEVASGALGRDARRQGGRRAGQQAVGVDPVADDWMVGALRPTTACKANDGRY